MSEWLVILVLIVAGFWMTSLERRVKNLEKRLGDRDATPL